MEKNRFSIKKRFKSFTYAFNGLKILLKEEHNSRIHISITILVTIAGVIFNITSQEWIFLILSIGLVISSELLNSAIENLSDFVSPEKHLIIKKVKDLSAAAVLVCAFVSVIVGFIVFTPYIFYMFKNLSAHFTN